MNSKRSSWLFWDVTWRRSVVTDVSVPSTKAKRSSSLLSRNFNPRKWDRKVVLKLHLVTTELQKSEELIYTAAVA